MLRLGSAQQFTVLFVRFEGEIECKNAFLEFDLLQRAKQTVIDYTGNVGSGCMPMCLPWSTITLQWD